MLGVGGLVEQPGLLELVELAQPRRDLLGVCAFVTGVRRAASAVVPAARLRVIVERRGRVARACRARAATKSSIGATTATTIS